MPLLPESLPEETTDLGALSGLAPTLAKTFVALTGDIALVVDGEGVVRNVAAGEAGLGASAADWVGRPWADTATGETRRKLELLLGEVRRAGRARRREVNHPSTTGLEIPVAWAAVRLGADGPVLALGRDLRAVTAIQQRFLDTQRALERDYWQRRQAEARYRLLFQVANDAVLVLDAHALRVVEGNQAAARLFGLPVEALAGTPAGTLWSEPGRPAFEQLLVSARSTGRAGEVRLRLGDDRNLVDVSATPFRADHQLLLLVRARPSAPTAEQRLLAELVARLPDAVAVTDGSGHLVAANPAFHQLAAAASGAVQPLEGKPIDTLLGDAGGQLHAVLARARRGGLAGRTPLTGAGGLSLAVSAVLMPDGDREHVGFTLAPHDPDAADPLALRPAAALAAAIAQLSLQVGHVPLPQLMREASTLAERHLVQAAIDRHPGDLDAAAGALGVTRHSLELRMRRLGLGPGLGPLPAPVG